MASKPKAKVMKYYVRGSTLPFEEDMTHEFKGHRNLSVQELPSWTKESSNEKASRKAISRNLNAFLNTGLGGTVYIGVVDSGRVHGLKMTRLQKEHFVGALNDVMARYSPPVAPHRYKVRFVPVVDSDSSREDILQLCSFDSSQCASASESSRKHVFQTPTYCWCDKEAVAQYNCGIVAPDYVVEVVVKPWKPDDSRNQGEGELINIHPLHSDEEGKIYFRRQASLVQYSVNSIAQMTRQEVKEQCEAEIERLKAEIALYKYPGTTEIQP
ncbi:hypothetical protein BaRGS_00001495 [Batillaria attramentaria]|uniref:Schlafen AlbA-2 domain-containing protein n=1 Tax=Batillaria attramentaria TaxID=370345 RepID=A0ABD0M6I4_9CAEN